MCSILLDYMSLIVQCNMLPNYIDNYLTLECRSIIGFIYSALKYFYYPNAVTVALLLWQVPFLLYHLSKHIRKLGPTPTLLTCFCLCLFCTLIICNKYCLCCIMFLSNNPLDPDDVTILRYLDENLKLEI